MNLQMYNLLYNYLSTEIFISMSVAPCLPFFPTCSALDIVILYHI